MNKIEKAKQFSAFITEVATAMQKHNVEDMLCIFGLNGEIRNTYIPLSGERQLYCKLSDGINEWLTGVEHHKPSGTPKHTGKLVHQSIRVTTHPTVKTDHI